MKFFDKMPFHLFFLRTCALISIAFYRRFVAM